MSSIVDRHVADLVDRCNMNASYWQSFGIRSADVSRAREDLWFGLHGFAVWRPYLTHDQWEEAPEDLRSLVMSLGTRINRAGKRRRAQQLDQ